MPHILSVRNEQYIYSVYRRDGRRQDQPTQTADVNNYSNNNPACTINSDEVSAMTQRGILQYLEGGRININVRQVVPDDGVWIDKCGTGSMQSMKPEFLKV